MSDMENRITDADAELLLAGKVPDGRPDLKELADAVTAFRAAAVDAAPRPSAELATRLSVPHDEPLAPLAAPSGAPTGRINADALVAGSTRPMEPIERRAEPVSRFGVVARVAVGVAAVLLGITVAGAAGALPGSLQDAFDGLVSTVIPSNDDVEPANADEEPAVGDEPVDGEESAGGAVPEEPASGDGDDSEPLSHDGPEPGHGEESDGDAEPGDAEEPDGDSEPQEPDEGETDGDSEREEPDEDGEDEAPESEESEEFDSGSDSSSDSGGAGPAFSDRDDES